MSLGDCILFLWMVLALLIGLLAHQGDMELAALVDGTVVEP